MLCAPPPPPSAEHMHGIDFAARLKSFMSLSTLAYSLVCMCNGVLFAVRDPFGWLM
jgi:glutamine phosphoribosylpyrophosphate amidotransferase